MLSPKVPVAQEGYPFIAVVAFLTLIAAIYSLPCLTIIGILLTVFVTLFFRDPERVAPSDPSQIVSPADGKIIIAEQVPASLYTDGPALKVSIFMNVFNVHVNRVPTSGTVQKVLYKPGKFYAADSHKGALQNECCATVLQLENGRQMAFVQIAGLIARRIVCWLEPKDTVVQGHRFGLIRFGSRVDVYLPADTRLTVKIGDKVRAGETVIGSLS